MSQKTINMTKQRSTKKQLCFTIGSKIEILDSANKTLINVKGTIIDETRYSLMIRTKTKTIKVLKSALKKIMLDDKEIDFDDFMNGTSLKQYFMKSIYDRIKKLYA